MRRPLVERFFRFSMNFRIAFWVLIFSLIPALGIAQPANVVSRSQLFDGTRYQFPLSDSELAKSPDWKPADTNPPLAARKAADLAQDYLEHLTAQKTSLGKKKIKWQLDLIKLQKVSLLPEHWIYLVNFSQDVSGYGVWTGPVEHVEIVVYLTGKIVDPVVDNTKSR